MLSSCPWLTCRPPTCAALPCTLMWGASSGGPRRSGQICWPTIGTSSSSQALLLLRPQRRPSTRKVGLCHTVWVTKSQYQRLPCVLTHVLACSISLQHCVTSAYGSLQGGINSPLPAPLCPFTSLKQLLLYWHCADALCLLQASPRVHVPTGCYPPLQTSWRCRLPSPHCQPVHAAAWLVYLACKVPELGVSLHLQPA